MNQNDSTWQSHFKNIGNYWIFSRNQSIITECWSMFGKHKNKLFSVAFVLFFLCSDDEFAKHRRIDFFRIRGHHWLDKVLREDVAQVEMDSGTHFGQRLVQLRTEKYTELFIFKWFRKIFREIWVFEIILSNFFWIFFLKKKIFIFYFYFSSLKFFQFFFLEFSVICRLPAKFLWKI